MRGPWDETLIVVAEAKAQAEADKAARDAAQAAWDLRRASVNEALKALGHNPVYESLGREVSIDLGTLESLIAAASKGDTSV